MRSEGEAEDGSRWAGSRGVEGALEVGGGGKAGGAEGALEVGGLGVGALKAPRGRGITRTDCVTPPARVHYHVKWTRHKDGHGRRA